MLIESLIAAIAIASLRTVEMSFDPVRISCIVQGRRKMAAALGFGQATVFALAAGIVFTGGFDPLRILGYGAGFAAGQYLGVTVVDRLHIGTATVRVYSPRGPIGVADALRAAGFTVTAFDGEGRDGPVRVILAVIPRREIKRLLATVRPWADQCYITVGDNAVVPSSQPFGRGEVRETAPAGA